MYVCVLKNILSPFKRKHGFFLFHHYNFYENNKFFCHHKNNICKEKEVKKSCEITNNGNGFFVIPTEKISARQRVRLLLEATANQL